jgi:hypothetical protein
MHKLFCKGDGMIVYFSFRIYIFEVGYPKPKPEDPFGLLSPRTKDLVEGYVPPSSKVRNQLYFGILLS